LQKLEGARAETTKGKAVVNYCEALATRDLVLKAFCIVFRIKRWHKIDSIL
jgi:hypothetical protein